MSIPGPCTCWAVLVEEPPVEGAGAAGSVGLLPLLHAQNKAAGDANAATVRIHLVRLRFMGRLPVEIRSSCGSCVTFDRSTNCVEGSTGFDSDSQVQADVTVEKVTPDAAHWEGLARMPLGFTFSLVF